LAANRIWNAREDNGDRTSRLLRSHRTRRVVCEDYVDFAANNFGCKLWKLIASAFRPSRFYNEVLAFHPA
jgi:hypothetical protein